MREDLDYIISYDLVISCTCFKKRNENLITYKGIKLHVRFFFSTRRVERVSCKNYKATPKESFITEDRHMVLDIFILNNKSRNNFSRVLKTRWWNWKGEIMLYSERKFYK